MSMSRPCKKCGSEAFRTEQKIFKNGTEHIARYCLKCESFIDYAAKEIPPGMFVMPYGRHKGKPLSWIVQNDRDYAEWLKANVTSETMRFRVEAVLEEFTWTPLTSVIAKTLLDASNQWETKS